MDNNTRTMRHLAGRRSMPCRGPAATARISPAECKVDEPWCLETGPCRRRLILLSRGMPPAARIPLVPRVTLVVPVFDREQELPEFLHRLADLFRTNPGIQWRALLLDHCRDDRGAGILEAQAKADPRFVPHYFTGHPRCEAAVVAALAHCEADAVITMNPDMRDPIWMVTRMIVAWSDGADVVRAKCDSPRDITGSDFVRYLSRHINRALGLPERPLAGAFCLFSRRALAQLPAGIVSRPTFPGSLQWVNCPVSEINYPRVILNNRA